MLRRNRWKRCRLYLVIWRRAKIRSEIYSNPRLARIRKRAVASKGSVKNGVKIRRVWDGFCPEGAASLNVSHR